MRALVVLLLVIVALGIVLYFSSAEDRTSLSSAAVSPKDFQLKQYKKVSISTDSRGDIRVDSREANGGGVYIHTRNTQSRSQIISLSGRALQGSTVLRVKRRNEPHLYIPAENTELRISLDPGENIELLLFQEAPFTYLIQELEKSDCPDCLDRDSLRQLIVDENPNLQTLLATRDWEKALITLLAWTSQQVDQGDTARTARTAINALRGQDLTYLFRKDELEGSCGLFAVYFAKILPEFGFRAVTLDFGLTRNQLTHVTTVVKAPDDRLYFVDPTFNAVYRDPHGSLVDIETALRSSEVRFSEAPIARDAWFSAEQLSQWQSARFFNEEGYDFQTCTHKTVDGEFKIFCPNMPYSSRLLKEVWAPRLQANQIPSDADLFRTMLTKGKVFSIGYQDPQLRDELTLLLRKAGVSFAE